MTATTSDHPLDELAVLAVDALGPDERDAVLAHVGRCPACRYELAEHRATLALLVPDVEPPASTWERIAAQVAASGNGNRGSGSPPPDPDPVSAGAEAVSARPEAVPAGPAVVSAGAEAVSAPARFDRARRASPRPPRRRWGRAALAIAATVAAVLAGVAALVPRGGHGSGDVVALAEAALRDPDATVSDLGTTDGRLLARVAATPDGAYVLDEGLPPLPAGRVYQLWAMGDGRAVSLGVLGDGRAAAVAVGAPPTAELAITEEKAPGATLPSMPAVATNAVPV